MVRKGDERWRMAEEGGGRGERWLKVRKSGGRKGKVGKLKMVLKSEKRRKEG